TAADRTGGADDLAGPRCGVARRTVGLAGHAPGPAPTGAGSRSDFVPGGVVDGAGPTRDVAGVPGPAAEFGRRRVEPHGRPDRSDRPARPATRPRGPAGAVVRRASRPESRRTGPGQF